MVVLPSVDDPTLVVLLTEGKVGVIPTDTIYGLVALAGNPQAVARLYALKHRDHKPGTVIAANPEQLMKLGVPAETVRAVAALWPNPLSIDMLVGTELDYLSQETGHCAFRIVADEEVRALLQKTGPLLTSSANDPGDPPAENLVQAQDYFGELVNLYVDGGNRSGRLPSTVARYRDGRFETVRPGAVTLDETGKIHRIDR